MGGLTEVLFEPESVRRDNTASEESGEATPTGTGRSADAASWGFGNGQVNGEYLEEKVGALNTMHDPKMIVTPTIVEVRQPKVKGQGGAGAMITENKCTTLSTSNTKTLICDETILNDQGGQS